MSTTKKSLFTSLISLMLCFVMLLGTTFAWFTDTATSKDNVIASGNLDIDLMTGTKTGNVWAWESCDGQAIFDYDKWEPGYTTWTALSVENNGNLSAKISAKIVLNGEPTILGDVIDVYKYTDDIESFNPDARPNFTDGSWISIGSINEIFEESATILQDSVINPGTNARIILALHMREDAGNECQGLDLGANFDIKIFATQASVESDSFDSDYDADAEFPPMNENYTVTVNVSNKLDSNNRLTEEVTIGDSTDDVNAVVPAGVSLAPGSTQLVLTVKTTERSGNIEVNRGQASRSLDVHVNGISEENTIPLVINLGPVMPTGLKSSSIVLYHVENETPVRMTAVDTLTSHNQFVYDTNSGEISVCMANFSEVTAVVAVGDPWAGAIDTSWYNTTDTEFTITTEEQFAGLGAIVGGMAEGITQDDFNGRTIILGDDLDLGGLIGQPWYPIGYYFTDDNNGDGTTGDYYCTVYSFEGVFDGNGKTIHNIYQSTWSMKGDDPHYDLSKNQYYNDGMGLFGFVYNGTVKNLTVNNFQSDGEFSTTGCVAAYAAGNASFENITITNSNPRAYNVPNGGVVGYAYASGEDTSIVNFENIKVDSSNKISALWGSWDVGCGGILGRVNGNATINMINCEVGAVIDVYNDVCGNYQYYQYRYAGMLIGTVGSDRDPTTGPEKVNFSNVKVYIGNWADYYYCEFEKNSVGSYTEDYQFSRVEKNEINIDPTTNLPYDGTNLSPCRHQHTEKEEKMGLYLPFNQLYTGYSWGASPVKESEGVEIINYFYTVTYMDGEGKNVLDTVYVTDGERSETKLWANAYNIRTTPVNNLQNKQFVGWVNSNSVKVESISAGNYKDILLYESWNNPYIIRFVDIDGNVVYSESWLSSNQGLAKDPPNPPEIEGYVGSWENGWENKLVNVTSDVTIKPVYILEKYEDEEKHVHLDSLSSAKELFTALEEGKSVIMGTDLAGSGKGDFGITGGNNVVSVIDDRVNSRLNLNSFELECTFDHNAKKSWHVFEIRGGATLTLSGGVTGDGIMVVNFTDVKTHVYLFNIENDGTLVLEAGVTIVINYPADKQNMVYGFMLNGEIESFAGYNGIYVDKTVDGKITITVGVTTTISGSDVQQN